MTDIQIYGVVGSPYLRAALLGLEEKGAQYHLVRLSPPETKQPTHIERHAFGRIPVIEHGDFRLYETQAILRYLDAIFPEPPLRPADPRAAARMDQMIGVTDWYVFRDMTVTISFNRIVAPQFGIPVDEAVITRSLPKAGLCLAEIDRLLGDKEFLAGDALSIADLMLAPQIDFLSMTPEGGTLLAPHPRVTAWLGRMRQRESMRATTWERLAQVV